MKAPTGRGPFGLTFQRCLTQATVPTLAAALLSLLLARVLYPQQEELGDAPGAMTPWLTLPLFVAALTCACSAAIFWPTFADRRPGADWLQRLQRGRLHGCGAVALAVLCVQGLLSLPLVTLLAPGLGAPTTARAQLELEPPFAPMLDQQQRRLRFQAPGIACTELLLRPLASLPAGPMRRSKLAVFADGMPLTTAEVAFAQTGQLVRVAFAATTFQRLDLELLEGTVPLFFPRGAVTVVAAAPRSGLWNGLCMTLLALVPTFVALAVGCLCGAKAAIPTVLTVIVSLLFLQTIGGLGPMSDALLLVMRGHWLPTASVFPACIPSLVVGSLAMILAMLLRSRLRR